MKTKIVVNPNFNILANFIKELANKGVPSNADEIYAGRNHIYHLQINNIDLNIKAFRCPGFPNNYVYSNIRASKAKRSYEYALEIRRRGISTPEPIAYIEKRKGNRLLQSYYICRQSAAIRDMRHWESWPSEESGRVVKALAVYMTRVHQAGILHHDFSPGNILWHENENGQIEFDIIDLNRMTLYDRPLTIPERFSNFRNINYCESQTQRLGTIYGSLLGLDPTKAGQRALDILTAEKKRKKRLHNLKKIFKPSK